MSSSRTLQEIPSFRELAGSPLACDDRPFRELLDQIPAGAYTCDAEGLITYFNERAVEVWGRRPRLNDPEDRFCGSFKLFATDGTPLRHDQCWMAKALQSRQGYNEQEIIVERPDSDRRWVLAYANPIREQSGSLRGAVNVLVDITSRKHDEDAVHASLQLSELSNRAKDRFLAVLSHELRGPLSPVMMTVSAMEADPELAEKFREDLAMIRRNLELEVKLIDDLLDVSRAINGKMRLHLQPVRVHEILRRAIANGHAELGGKSLTFCSTLSASNDHVMADPARLHQVFSNLLRNATKFTPTGGNVNLRTWNAEGSGQIGIEIRDTGVGIRAEALPGIFEPFDQGEPDTAQHFGGLGLGLSIAKAVIELHGGTIVAASEGRDRGAVFTIQLNTADPPAIVDHVAPRLKDFRGASGLRLLIVEDHNDTANAMARLLRSEGYEVSIANSVAAALQAAAAGQFDIVVSDIGLPDSTGYDLMMQIRNCSRIKGIALSGHGAAEDVQRALGAGFSEHMVKPVDVHQLIAVINRIAQADPR